MNCGLSIPTMWQWLETTNRNAEVDPQGKLNSYCILDMLMLVSDNDQNVWIHLYLEHIMLNISIVCCGVYDSVIFCQVV